MFAGYLCNSLYLSWVVEKEKSELWRGLSISFKNFPHLAWHGICGVFCVFSLCVCVYVKDFFVASCNFWLNLLWLFVAFEICARKGNRKDEKSEKSSTDWLKLLEIESECCWQQCFQSISNWECYFPFHFPFNIEWLFLATLKVAIQLSVVFLCELPIWHFKMA